MKKIIIITIALILSGCSLKRSHIAEIQKNENGDEYSILDTRKGFIVYGHYSDYQFVRNSKNSFIGCLNILNNAAKEYSSQYGLSVDYPKWRDIEIVDHGRDIVTAIMRVNCKYQYQYK